MLLLMLGEKMDKIKSIKQVFDKFYSENVIKFDDKGHTYEINGELFTGTTTVTAIRQKEFLPFLAAKEFYTYLKNLWDITKKYTEEEKEELLLNGKKAWTQKKQKGADSGTIAHDWISDYILGKSLNRSEDKEANNAIDAFLRWEKARQPVWIASEKIVASLSQRVAGKIDSLALLDNKVTLLDFKTSGTIDESFLLQLFGYELQLEEMGVKLENRLVLRIPKDGKDAEELPIKSGIEEFCKRTFIHCREVHKFNVYVKNNLTDKEGNILLKGESQKGKNV